MKNKKYEYEEKEVAVFWQPTIKKNKKYEYEEKEVAVFWQPTMVRR